MNQDRPVHAVSYMLGAQFCFSCNILLLRLSEKAEQEILDPLFRLSPWEPMLCRSILLTAWCIFILRRRKELAPRGRESFWLWARGIAGGLSLSSYYYGVLHIPLGVASLFSNSSPLYVAVLAAIIEKEKIRVRRILSLVGGFLGVALVGYAAGMHLEHVVPFALIVAAFSGPLSATAYFSIRQLKGVSNERIMLSLGISGTLISILALCWKGIHFPESSSAMALLLLSTLPAMQAQEYLTRAFRSAPATQVAPLQFTGPIFASGLAYLALGETLPELALFGIGVVILFGLIQPYLYARQEHKKLVAQEND